MREWWFENRLTWILREAFLNVKKLLCYLVSVFTHLSFPSVFLYLSFPQFFFTQFLFLYFLSYFFFIIYHFQINETATLPITHTYTDTKYILLWRRIWMWGIFHSNSKRYFPFKTHAMHNKRIHTYIWNRLITRMHAVKRQCWCSYLWQENAKGTWKVLVGLVKKAMYSMQLVEGMHM